MSQSPQNPYEQNAWGSPEPAASPAPASAPAPAPGPVPATGAPEHPVYGSASPVPGYGSASPTPAHGGASPTPGYGSTSPTPDPAAWSGGTLGASTRKDGAGFFRAMVDFRFEHFVTVKFSSFLYAIAWIVAILLWGWNILSSIVFGVMIGSAGSFYSDEPSFSVWPLVIAVLLGWIPSVIAIILFRLGLEFSVAVVRTAQNTGALVEHSEQS
ncbi:DUF4282 domain-containing protein [Brachybacterium hainanense]|uniref:DUF4282 domain-containing protein n=1 Tax=Brachybacterium hainanense TaxID=1541174 RepID=A0ABV6R7I2_9MICO